MYDVQMNMEKSQANTDRKPQPKEGDQQSGCMMYASTHQPKIGGRRHLLDSRSPPPQRVKQGS